MKLNIRLLRQSSCVCVEVEGEMGETGYLAELCSSIPEISSIKSKRLSEICMGNEMDNNCPSLLPVLCHGDKT